jgi:RNA polymerase sigma-70 factor, ECF subfamily
VSGFARALRSRDMSEQRTADGAAEAHDRAGAEELALAARAAQGDHEAFRQIVLRYEGRLLAFLAQMLGDAETARDVAQEAFVAAYTALPQWQPPTGAHAHPLAPWLYRIASNRALSVLRQSGPPQSDWQLAEVTATQGGWEDHFIARELLQQALHTLTADDAACLVLHFVAGERYGEIGERLGLTAEAVRKRVARGLVALRAAYHALDVEVRE